MALPLVSLAVAACGGAQHGGPDVSVLRMFAGGGWAVIGGRLEATADGGHTWSERMPRGAAPLQATGAALLDIAGAAQAWVAFTAPAGGVLAATSDAGRSWREAAIPLASVGASRPVGVSFIDPLHGWVAVAGGSQTGARLLGTADGGASWDEDGAIPVSGPIVFDGPNLGWVAGGSGQRDLFHTADGGRSWQHLDLPLPPVPQESNLVLFRAQLPEFVDAAHGVLPVAYTDTRLIVVGLIVELYSTSDGGVTWDSRTAVELRSPGAIDQGSFSAVDALDWRFAVHNVLYSTSDGGGSWTYRPVALASLAPAGASSGGTSGFSLAAVSFSSAADGWAILAATRCPTPPAPQSACTHTSTIIRSSDGGEQWRRAT